MTVHYYGIANCEFGYLDGAPVIIAPPDTDTALLTQYAFEQDADGRWFHALTVNEMQYINSGADPAIFGETPKSINVPRRLHIIALLCCGLGMYIPLLVPIVSHIPFSLGTAMLLAGGCITAGLILMIYMNVRYPSRKAKKALLRYLFLHAANVLAFLLFVSTCQRCTSGFSNCFNSCKGCTAGRSESSNADSLAGLETLPPPDAEHSGS